MFPGGPIGLVYGTMGGVDGRRAVPRGPGLTRGVCVMADAYDGVTGAGGGQIASRGTGDIPALPGSPAPVTITAWPPASWGPKRWTIDTSGRRTAVAPPGE